MEVSGLFIYPVKAVRAVALSESVVEPRGLAGDRRWLFVDADDRFLTQRDHPILATVVASLSPDALTLHHPSVGSVEVPEPIPTSQKRLVTIWRNQVRALDAGQDAADWATELLCFPVRLVFMGPASVRPVDPDYGRPGDEVSFADGYPLLLTNEASLADLNTRLADPVPMSRFRPNVIVSGAVPWAEDAWKRLRIGEVEFLNVKPCGRCIVTTTDQETGSRTSDEPLRTLTAIRLRDQKAMFGWNLIPVSRGSIRVGDYVEAH